VKFKVLLLLEKDRKNVDPCLKLFNFASNLIIIKFRQVLKSAIQTKMLRKMPTFFDILPLKKNYF